MDLRRLLGSPAPRKLAMAVSGGVDSMAMAHQAAAWARPRGIDLHGFVIDHHARSGSAQEAAAVADQLQKWGIESAVLDLDTSVTSSSKMETFARNGRRALLEHACMSRNIHALMHAHTLDDQIELFILRLLSRSTWYGLAGMQESSWLTLRPPPSTSPVRLVKPLLHTRKADLYRYCTEQNIQWFEDPTNQDIALTKRNAVRALLKDPQSLPPGFQPDAIIELQSTLQKNRALVESTALLAYRQLKLSQQLVLGPGSATLHKSAAFDAMPLDAKTQLLLMILCSVAPHETDQLFYRRSTVSQYLKDDPKDRRTLLNTLITPSKDTLVFERAPLRIQQSLDYQVYPSTHEWSEWRLIDNRFWMRWKLPEEDPAKSRQLTVRLLYSTRQAHHLMKDAFGHSVGTPSERLGHPFFMFDGEDPYAFDPLRLVGYPTLNYYQALQVEWKQVETVWDLPSV